MVACGARVAWLWKFVRGGLLLSAFFVLWNLNVEHVKLRLATSSETPQRLYRDSSGLASASSKCGCSGMFLDANKVRDLEARANATTLVALRKPSRRFHSNHWFHDGEYFLSMHSNAALRRIVQRDDVIIIMANEAKFVRQLTNVAAFLLLLALSPDDSARRLDVYEPAYLSVRVDADDNRWGSFASYGPGFIYDRGAAPEEHFKAVAFGARNGQDKVCHCGKLVDFVGKKPTRSSQWFRSHAEVADMRAKAASICARASNLTLLDPLGATLKVWPGERERHLTGNAGGPPPVQQYLAGSRALKLVVYQRNSNRKFSDLDALLQHLSAGLHGVRGIGDDKYHWKIHVLMHDENMQPCLLYHALADADLFLTTHGFQATALMFMKPGAVLLEVFPYKYWKNSYIDLCGQFGIHHRWIQNQSPTSMSRHVLRIVPQSVCMQFNRCRSHARADNVAMPPPHMEFLLKTARQVAAGQLGPHSAPSYSKQPPAKRILKQ